MSLACMRPSMDNVIMFTGPHDSNTEYDFDLKKQPRGSSTLNRAKGVEEDWTTYSGAADRRRLQNRLAQRTYRRNAREREHLKKTTSPNPQIAQTSAPISLSNNGVPPPSQKHALQYTPPAVPPNAHFSTTDHHSHGIHMLQAAAAVVTTTTTIQPDQTRTQQLTDYAPSPWDSQYVNELGIFTPIRSTFSNVSTPMITPVGEDQEEFFSPSSLRHHNDESYYDPVFLPPTNEHQPPPPQQQQQQQGRIALLSPKSMATSPTDLDLQKPNESASASIQSTCNHTINPHPPKQKKTQNKRPAPLRAQNLPTSESMPQFAHNNVNLQPPIASPQTSRPGQHPPHQRSSSSSTNTIINDINNTPDQPQLPPVQAPTSPSSSTSLTAPTSSPSTTTISATTLPTKGLSPLHKAVYAGHTAIVTILLDHGASASLKTSTTSGGLTALHIAVLRNHISIVSLLLSRTQNHSPKSSSSKSKSQNTTKTSSSTSSTVNEPSTTGLTPLHIAAAEGHSSLLPLLLSHGAVVDALDHMGRSPLWMAARKGCVECVRTLLEGGAEVNRVDSAGVSALHVAAENGWGEVVTELLVGGWGADVDCRTGE